MLRKRAQTRRIPFSEASKTGFGSGAKNEHKPKLLSPDIFRWGGGLPREGVGAKKFGMPLETREIEREKSLCSIFGPYWRGHFMVRFPSPPPKSHDRFCPPLCEFPVQKVEKGKMWSTGEIRPYAPIPLEPAACVLNYGQGLFEGLKAQRTKQGDIVLFRPDCNASRMKAGALRLGMAPVPRQGNVKRPRLAWRPIMEPSFLSKPRFRGSSFGILVFRGT